MRSRRGRNFPEVHENPAKALSDGTNALPLDQFRPLVEKIAALGACEKVGRLIPRLKPM